MSPAAREDPTCSAFVPVGPTPAVSFGHVALVRVLLYVLAVAILAVVLIVVIA